MPARLLLLAAATLLIACGGTTVIDPGSGSGGASSTSSSTGGGDPNCMSTARSSLDGVTLTFPPQRCTYTLAEAAAGIEIRHQTVIENAIDGIYPEPLDIGRCSAPSNSGLILYEVLAGGPHSYCLCDMGLCAPPPIAAIELQPGTYDGAFSWNGLNWAGPSDTGNPPGPPFPPGTYTLGVSAIGSRYLTTSFDMLATFELTLVP